VIAEPFLPETKGKPLPHALWLETPTPSTSISSAVAAVSSARSPRY
jgi:hypothetical protein